MSGRTRRDGLVCLALALGGTALGAWLTYRFQLPALESVTAFLPSLAGLYLSWAAFRAERAGAEAAPDPARLADQLAVAVRGQWEAELRVRRINDPYPLPVSWRAAAPDLAEPWPLLRQTAVGWPGGPPSDPEGWAGGPSGLAGTGGELGDVFLHRVPTRRLLLLGRPGAGKTMLLLRLLLSLLARRAEGAAVPVLFPLASWNPDESPLRDWMAERLARDYSGLADPTTTGSERLGRARTLLERGLVLPILDGFDEIPGPLRGQALDAINASLPLGQELILSSRVAEYRDVLFPVAGLPVRLAGAAAVELAPLDARDAAEYLRRDAGGHGTAAASRWEAVVARLGDMDDPVGQALRTPLMLGLARTVYNPRPGEHSSALPDPALLCDRARFPTAGAIQGHLLEAFIPAAYRSHPRYPCRWTVQQARRTLTFLARHLDRDVGGSTDLAWWQLYRALPARLPQLVAAAVIGAVAWFTSAPLGRLIAELAGLDSGWLTGPPAGVVGGLAGGIAAGTGCGVAAGSIAGVAEGLTTAVATGSWHALLTTTANGLAYGFVGGIVGALCAGPSAPRAASDPEPGDGSARNRGAGARRGGSRWPRGRRVPNRRGLALGLVCGGALWFAFEPVYGPFAACAGAVVNAGVYGLAGAALTRPVGPLSARGAGPAPAIRPRWAWDRRGFTVGLLSGPAVAVTHWSVIRIQAELTGEPGYPTAAMLSFMCAYALAVGLACGIRSRPADLATAVGPAVLLAQDRRTHRRLWTAVGAAVGSAFALCYGAEYLLDAGLPYGLSRGTSDAGPLEMGPAQILVRTLAYGTTVGLATALGRTAWWYYALARHHLALRRRITTDLTAFLADAHERRGVLRQVGAVYQFRHIDLQHHLAGTVPPAVPAARRRAVPGARSGAPTRRSRARP
ncbi:NACHT domain-containing protein [Wenjunlia tyrosinilytica]|nr:NACHT domain-containing protein [Wenjunlia tyrosinilytica]